MQDRLLRLNQIVPQILPISKTKFWQLVKEGVLKPIKLGPRTTAFSEQAIRAIVQKGVADDATRD